MKNNKGITLVILVVTIVIMLILLGVSMSFIIRDDGLVGSAQKAKNQIQNKIDEQNQWTQRIIDEF